MASYVLTGITPNLRKRLVDSGVLFQDRSANEIRVDGEVRRDAALMYLGARVRNANPIQEGLFKLEPDYGWAWKDHPLFRTVASGMPARSHDFADAAFALGPFKRRIKGRKCALLNGLDIFSAPGASRDLTTQELRDLHVCEIPLEYRNGYWAFAEDDLQKVLDILGAFVCQSYCVRPEQTVTADRGLKLGLKQELAIDFVGKTDLCIVDILDDANSAVRRPNSAELELINRTVDWCALAWHAPLEGEILVNRRETEKLHRALNPHDMLFSTRMSGDNSFNTAMFVLKPAVASKPAAAGKAQGSDIDLDWEPNTLDADPSDRAVVAGHAEQRSTRPERETIVTSVSCDGDVCELPVAAVSPMPNAALANGETAAAVNEGQEGQDAPVAYSAMREDSCVLLINGRKMSGDEQSCLVQSGVKHDSTKDGFWIVSPDDVPQICDLLGVFVTEASPVNESKQQLVCLLSNHHDPLRSRVTSEWCCVEIEDAHGVPRTLTPTERISLGFRCRWYCLGPRTAYGDSVFLEQQNASIAVAALDAADLAWSKRGNDLVVRLRLKETV